jgi:hypothetical protein
MSAESVLLGVILFRKPVSAFRDRAFTSRHGACDMQPVVFMARLIGPLFVVLAIGMLLNSTLYADMIGQAVMMPVVIALSGILSFSAGVAMLNGYHVWTFDWRIIITVLAWLLVIAGVIRIVLPVVAAAAALAVYSSGGVLIAGVIVLLIGAYLSFEGYRRRAI